MLNLKTWGRIMRSFDRVLVIAVALFVSAFCVAPAVGADASGSIGGIVYNASTGAPVAGAKVTLFGNGSSNNATTDDHGAFTFASVSPGTWFLRTLAQGYQLNVSGAIVVTAGQPLDVSVALQAVSTTNIATLGRVVVSGQRTLNTSTAAAITISTNQYISTGTPQIQQLLETTPGLTVEHFNNGAPGNVATFTIRGTGGFVGGSNTGYEVLVLQDGEPIRNGQYGDADLSGLTPAIYSRVEVVKGVGGTSLFGANTIGGTLNLVTIDPKQTEGAALTSTLGSFGTTDYNLLQTNTYGRVGYVLDFHQFGTDGFIPPGLLVDSPPCGFCPGIMTPPTGFILHPTVSMLLRSGLAKIRYRYSNTSFSTLTFTDEADWRDQFGLLANPTTIFLPDLNGGTVFSNDSSGFPYFFGFPMNYVWNTSPKYSFDYHTGLGGGELIVRYSDNWLNRWVDGNNAPPQSCCFLQKSLDHITGVLATWDKVYGNHDVTFAVGGNGDSFQYGQCFSSTPCPAAAVPVTAGSQIERTLLVRDDYEVSPKFRATFAGYYSNYNDLNVRRIDPRLAILNRPDNDTAIRFSVGSGFAAPRLSDIVAPLNNSVNSSSPGPNCTVPDPFCNGSQGNLNLKEETALGYDFGYERTWGLQGDFSVDFYRTTLHNHIFQAILPAAPGATLSDGTTPMLGIITPINIAASIYSGVEFSGSLPVTGNLAVKGYYNTQASYPINVDLLTEQNLGNVINNQQYQGVPLHKVGWSINYQNRTSTSASIGGDWYAANNSYNVPQFWSYNAGIGLPFSPSTSVHLNWHNIFNKNANIFSNFNGGVPYPSVVGFNGCTVPPCTSATTAFSMSPTTFTVTLDTKWGSLR